jgi:hypothetical protein
MKTPHPKKLAKMGYNGFFLFFSVWIAFVVVVVVCLLLLLLFCEQERALC